MDELGGQHALRRVLWIDLRHDDSIFVGEEISGSLLILRLAFVVDFKVQHSLDFFEMRLHGLPILTEPRRKEERMQIAKVGVDSPCDSGILNFDGDVRTRFQSGSM